jgi:hypothetical protein
MWCNAPLDHPGRLLTCDTIVTFADLNGEITEPLTAKIPGSLIEGLFPTTPSELWAAFTPGPEQQAVLQASSTKLLRAIFRGTLRFNSSANKPDMIPTACSKGATLVSHAPL